MAIAIFFIAHWQLSVFFQTFFLHRYGAHRMYTMSKGWERFFSAPYLRGTQGPSFLVARVRDPPPGCITPSAIRSKVDPHR